MMFSGKDLVMLLVKIARKRFYVGERRGARVLYPLLEQQSQMGVSAFKDSRRYIGSKANHRGTK
jgi:hypothetical protein